MLLKFPIKKNITILALGAESAGNFSVYSHPHYPLPLSKGEMSAGQRGLEQGRSIYLSPDFGDLLEEKKWHNYQKAVLKYLKNNKIKPEIILTDLHPLFKTSAWGKELAKKYKAKFIPVQHHHAHIFSAIGDKLINPANYKLPSINYVIAIDGTGYGTDEKIWGGEVFVIENIYNCHSREGGNPVAKYKIRRIGHLENQILIGGDLAIQEPARMLISILYKVFSDSSSPACGRGCRVLATGEGGKKENIYSFVKKYYNQNEFELLYNQLQQNFNCLETSSAGRILDALSLLLGFCKNQRDYKHQPINLLEKSSTKPFTNLKPKIIKNKDGEYILDTTYLFKYLLSYLRPYLHTKKDTLANKKKLAATAQLYIAQGLYEIIKLSTPSPFSKGGIQGDSDALVSGGLANNKIISSFLESKGVYGAKKIPRGDAGLSFGQIVYWLLSK